MNLYIHFPYCLYKCHYCDFNSHATPGASIPSAEYVTALLLELERHSASFSGSRLDTIFIGGGTPSLLPSSEVDRLLTGISCVLDISGSTEITLEANPKTIDREKLRGFKNAGVNRVSVGVQSLNDRFLKPFGRIHTANDALEALFRVAETGFSSWNTDLIFGFPGQTLAQWETELSHLLSLRPPHLSCYALTVEDETLYSHHIAQGKSERPDEDLQAEMLASTFSLLASAGYTSYEISNHSLPGYHSRHNLNYWQYGSYLGIGAGAVSFLHNGSGKIFGVRTTNLKEPKKYLEAVATGENFFLESEEISRVTAMGEFMMMGLRLKEGADPAAFHQFFGSSLAETFSETVEGHRSHGLMAPEKFSLTGRGRMVANQVMSDYF